MERRRRGPLPLPRLPPARPANARGRKGSAANSSPKTPRCLGKRLRQVRTLPGGQAARRKARLTTMRRSLTLHGRAPRLCTGPSSQLCRLQGACGASVRARRPVVTSHALGGVTSFQASLWLPPSPFRERRTRAARSGLTPLLPSRVPVGRHLRSGSRSLIPFPERLAVPRFSVSSEGLAQSAELLPPPLVE